MQKIYLVNRYILETKEIIIQRNKMLNVELLKLSACLSLSAAARRCLHLRPKSVFSSPRAKASPPFRHVVQLGDPVLRVECEAVQPGDIKTRQVQEVIDAMKFALTRFDGVGLSAPQIGVPLQIMMVQFTQKQINVWSEDVRKKKQMEVLPLKIFLNPKLTILDKTQVRSNHTLK